MSDKNNLAIGNNEDAEKDTEIHARTTDDQGLFHILRHEIIQAAAIGSWRPSTRDYEVLPKEGFPIVEWFKLNGSQDLTRTDLGELPLIITREVLQEIGGFLNYVSPLGQIHTIDEDSFFGDDPLLYYPEDLGD
jgi:hypothetical protein